MVRLGLLGCGRVGKVHAAAIQRVANVSLVAAYDPVAELASELATETGATVRSPEEMMASADIDGILIATPTATHADFIAEAVKHRKPVLCEKPIDLDLDRLRSCYAEIRDRAPFVHVAFNRRFDPNIALLHKAVAGGDAGSVESIHVITRVPKPPPYKYVMESGGLFRDMTIHDIDLIRFLAGENPVSVSAVGDCLIDPGLRAYGDIDSAMLTFTFANGMMAHIANSRRSAYGLDHRVEVFGSAGLVTLRNGDAPAVQWSDASGTGRRGQFHWSPIYGYMESYERQVEAFGEAIATGAASPVPFEDGWAATVIAEGAYRALESGAAVDLRPMIASLDAASGEAARQ